METRWMHVTSEDFPNLVKESKEVCLIPMGCIEKHGLHLPLGTDVFEASHITYLASQIETACVFPDFTFGDVPEAAPTMPAGSITIPMDLEMQMLEVFCEQIARNGFKKILICNAHGGNTGWLSVFLRKMTNKKRDFVCAIFNISCSRSPYNIADVLESEGRGSVPELTSEDEDLILDFCAEKKNVGHACMGETACVLGIYPETVKLDRLGIESGLSLHKTDYFKEVGITIRDGGWGIDHPYAFSGHDPIGCNERIGKAAVRIKSEMMAKAIKVFKEDENLWKWHEELQQGW